MKSSTYVALAKTSEPPAMAPPLHAHPMPRIHARVLSSLDSVHLSIHSLRVIIPRDHASLSLTHVPLIVTEDVRRPGLIPISGLDGAAVSSDLAWYTVSNCVFEMYWMTIADVMRIK